MSRLTKPQSKALAFFEANEADPVRNFGKRPPSFKTTNWLIKRLYLEKRAVGQFDFNRFVLTDLGRQRLARDDAMIKRRAGQKGRGVNA